MANMIEFEIDGKKITAEPGRMIIEVADREGIYIPRFCYHKKLSIAANCRMCLVEVEKSGKPLPACATPVTPGMKVFTKSPKAVLAQRAVMEFLLINHPLDCPVCDQGGECELQDLSMGYGSSVSRYNQAKRSVHDKDLGPLVSSDMTRCIQCTRCVRFGEEIAGMRELGAYNRGEHLEIGTYVQKAMKSELSANVIDICPVGALTNKPFRFTARSWEMQQHEAVAPHDCIGSNIYVHTNGEEFSKRRKVMRVVPRTNEAINENWISDRDRFSYAALQSEERILQPRIKQNGLWQETDWETALNYVTDHLKHIIQHDGAEQIGAIASPNSTLEEFYLLQKLWRGIGSNNVDHRIREIDTRDQTVAPTYPSLGMPIVDLEKQEAILLIGSDLRREQPMGNHRVRKAWLQDAKIMAINPVDYNFNYDLSEKWIINPQQFPLALAEIAKALHADELSNLSSSVKKLLEKVNVEKTARAIARQLKENQASAILLGAQAMHHPQAALIRQLATIIAQQSGAKLGTFTAGANGVGAWLAGAIPHREAAAKTVAKSGLSTHEMFTQKLKAYLVLGVEPEFDCTDAYDAVNAMQSAELVVMLSPFLSANMAEYVDVILPVAPFTENPGTYVNIEGIWQSIQPATLPEGEVRPAWKVLRVLGNLFDLESFSYVHCHEIRDEVKALVDKMSASVRDYSLEIPYHEKNGKLIRISQWPMYRIDGMVRRSKPLQDTLKPNIVAIHINSELAKRLNLRDSELAILQQQDKKITLPVKIDDAVATDTVCVMSGLVETAGFGCAFGEIELRSLSSSR